MWRSMRRLCILLTAAAGAQFLAAAPVYATAGTITEVSLPPNGGWCSCPATIALGPDGNLWFTETGGALGYGAIGTISPTLMVTEYKLSTYDSIPVGIAAGPNGDGLWFTEQNTNRIGLITTAGQISEFPLTLSGSQPRGIALGSDGNLWFTQSLSSTTTTTCFHHKCSTSTSTTTGYIGRITPTGTVAEFAISNAYSRPLLITSGPDSNLWFTDEGTNSIGRINPVTDAIAEFPLPTAGSGPHGITTGPDKNIWATEAYANQIAQITTGGTIKEFSAPWGGPAGIAGPNTTNLWFTETGSSTNPAAIGEMTTSGAGQTNFPLSGGVDPQGITLGSDGRLWFTEEFGGTNGAIGAVTAS
jgi:streptogramin lyase